MWPDGSGPTQIVDDGGDATLLVHKGVEFEKAGKVPAFNAENEPEEWGVILELLRKEMTENPAALDEGRRRSARRQRRDDDRRAPALPDDGGRHAAVSGDQRQRLGHEEQVRQHLRLPPLAHRRPEPRDRRHARRQGRCRLRLRRGRQGLRAGAARPGRPRHRDRDRPHLRAAGRDGRIRGQDARGRRLDRRHLRDRDRQPEHHHRASTWRG